MLLIFSIQSSDILTQTDKNDRKFLFFDHLIVAELPFFLDEAGILCLECW